VVHRERVFRLEANFLEIEGGGEFTGGKKGNEVLIEGARRGKIIARNSESRRSFEIQAVKKRLMPLSYGCRRGREYRLSYELPRGYSSSGE